MSWRTVVITSRCKLDLSMNCLVVRDEEIRRINLDEISELIIENSAVSITGCLLVELAKKKVNVVICDEKRNPLVQSVSMYGSFDCSSKIKKQISWNKDFSAILWSEIVAEKIRKQAEHLDSCGLENEAAMLKEYISQIEVNDESNREGHAAKVYFNALFGKSFTRSNDCAENAALNYGYSLILSAVNREIVSNGYLTQLGLFHDNTFNFFNLSCDIMEPWRVLVDRIVKSNGFTVFEKREKHIMLEVFKMQVTIDSTRQYLSNAIKIYCRSIFEALNEMDTSLVKNYKYEL